MSVGAVTQFALAAYYGAKTLAGSVVEVGLGLPPDAAAVFVVCEADQAVDDVIVGLSNGGHVFCQSKTAPSLSPDPESDLGKACGQFVRQYAAHAGRTLSQADEPSWARQLDPQRDRLALVVGPGAPGTIRNDLLKALARARDGVGGKALSKDEQYADEVIRGQLRGHLAKHWPAAGEADVDRLMTLIRVQTLDLRPEGGAADEARTALRGVLTDPTRAADAFDLLNLTFADAAVRRTGQDRASLRVRLADRGMLARPALEYRQDVERLRALTRDTLARLRKGATTTLGGTRIKIDRKATADVLGSLAGGSVLVTGAPGGGKSAVATDTADLLIAAGRDVVAFTADRVFAGDEARFSRELGLHHPLSSVLAEWTGDRPGYLFIDALDSARDTTAAEALRELMGNVLTSGGRWQVMAVVRQYDLRHSPELVRLFPAPATAGARPDELGRTRHVFVKPFNDDELAQAAVQSPTLAAVLAGASAALRKLLAEPFNLALVAALADDGVAIAELNTLTTQGRLLDRFWDARVRGVRRFVNEKLLEDACREMIRRRRLWADVRDLQTPDTAALTGLLSGGPLIQWQPRPAGPPDDYALAFSHHLLFDYAAARLLLRAATAERAVAFQASQPADLPLLIRPSLSLHARHLWDEDRSSFWDYALACVRSPELGTLNKLVPPTEAAEAAVDPGDFGPLCDALEAEVAGRTTVGEAGTGSAVELLRHIVGAVGAMPDRPASGRPVPWYELAERASRLPSRPVLVQIRNLLPLLEAGLPSTGDARRLVNAAARRLMAAALAHPKGDRVLSDVAIGAVCQTLSVAPVESAALVRRVLEPGRLERIGSDESFRVALCIKELAVADSALAAEVYEAAFGTPVPDAVASLLFDSRILPMRSTRKQDHESVLDLLNEDLPALLAADPAAGARATAAVQAGPRARIDVPSPLLPSATGGAGTIESRSPDERALDNARERFRLWTAQGGDELGEQILSVARQSIEQTELNERSAGDARGVIAEAYADRPNDPVRQRIVAWCRTLADTLAVAYGERTVAFERTKADDLTEADRDRQQQPLREEAARLCRIAYKLAGTLYYVSGAYGSANASKGPPWRIAPDRARDFYRDFGPILTTLGHLPDPAIAHRLVETLAAFVAMSPVEVTLRIRDVVVAAAAAGYTAERIAAGSLLRAVERVLAQSRAEVLGIAEGRQAIVQLLEAFIDWPEARQVVYRLDELDR